MKEQKKSTFHLYDHHASVLKGAYELSIKQKIKDVGELAEINYHFQVGQKILRLAPSQIHSVYPPPNSTGDYAHHLPHLMLEDSTIPWGESMVGGDKKDPYLFLLLVDESEQHLIREEVETDKNGKSARTLISLPTTFLRTFFKQDEALKNLRYLVHVRRLQGGDSVISQRACIIGNRLPKVGSSSTVYLISMADPFDYTSLLKEQELQFHCLFSYQFHTETTAHDLLTPLQHLKVDNINSSRTTTEITQEGEGLMQGAFVPLPHFFRTGEKSHSFYRGPLVPVGTTSSVQDLPYATAADQLLRVHPQFGLLDVSYAAAWNLGRYLTLNSKTLVSALAGWKRAHAHQFKQDQVHEHLEASLLHRHHPIQQQVLNQKEASFTLPLVLRQAVGNWMNLTEIPMSYLLPDKKMLPEESLRFFEIDENWVKAFLNGVFEVGFAGLSTDRVSLGLWEEFWEEISKKRKGVKGFVIRSQILIDFPALEINGSFDNQKSLIDPPLRILRNNEFIMVLLEQEVDNIVFSLPNHSMHAGIEKDNETSEWVLNTKDSDPNESEPVKVPFLPDSSSVIDIPELLNRLPDGSKSNSEGSAKLAYHLLRNGTAASILFPRNTLLKPVTR